MKIEKSLFRISEVFDTLFTSKNVSRIEKWVVYIAAAGFLLHLGAIFLVRNLEPLPALISQVSPYYLSSVYTPFSLILFTEVLLLVITIPSSLTSSIGKQFEIMSLIVIRGVFRDMGRFLSPVEWFDHLDAVRAVLIDMAGGLGLFLLVTVFYHVNNKRPTREKPVHLAKFIVVKKNLALILAALLIVLALRSLVLWLGGIFYQPVGILPVTVIGAGFFFHDLFMVMIFTDVLLLILSSNYSTSYDQVFRNAGFVISTILIRLSLTAPKPYNILLATIAMIFGISILVIYNYHCKVTAASESR